tara:strand:+ start:47 stop:274 length:228 start_codon:yes stop_codon:yes gene_type:complete
MADFYSKAPVDTKASKVIKPNVGLKAKLFGKHNTPKFSDVVGSNNPKIAKKIAKAKLRNLSIKAKLKNIWKQLSN